MLNSAGAIIIEGAFWSTRGHATKITSGAGVLIIDLITNEFKVGNPNPIIP